MQFVMVMFESLAKRSVMVYLVYESSVIIIAQHKDYYSHAVQVTI